MRSVIKGPAPVDALGAPVAFPDYQASITHLKERLGRYCSYCERTIPVGLAVEHKRPKEHHPELELIWDNFLLACANCNSSKGQANPPLGSVVWPDEDDTFALIAYFPSGAVKPKADLLPETFARVASTLEMLGLSKEPRQAPLTDHRHFDRLEVWQRAMQSKADLESHDAPELRRQILQTAKATGGYSIWQSVFVEDTEMRRLFAQSFPGTRASQVA